ncbi:MAG TPA: OsmC family protein [Acidimicrobiales bacterium]|nr:OsmC family protein [Acidimicrobiales bacterium]
MTIRETQRHLRERYATQPASFAIQLRVRGGSGDLSDPLHAEVEPASVPGTKWKSGAHPAVGGEGDAPCSADLLLGALAACQEITLRMVAANMGIELEELQIDVEGDWDPRGTLAMGREFPVGLTGIRCRTRVVVHEDEPSDRGDRLLRSAERYCVVLNTLRQGLPVETTFELKAAD